MDIITLALCKNYIKSSIEALGDVFEVKGKVDSVNQLPQTGNKNGDVWLVGPQTDGSYDEYFWSSLNKWEIMGSTGANLTDVVTEEVLYKGEDKTGTVQNPAEGTVLYIIKELSQNYTNENFLSKTNETAYTPTSNYHPATKKYVDDSVAAHVPIQDLAKYPDINTTGTTKQFFNSIINLNLPVGTILFGEVHLKYAGENNDDFLNLLGNEEIKIEILEEDLIYGTILSTNISPYKWEIEYWTGNENWRYGVVSESIDSLTEATSLNII